MFSLTAEYNLEILYRKPFLDLWNDEKDDPELGPLSERMGVRARGGGPIQVTDEELEAASKFWHFLANWDGIKYLTQYTGFYHAFVFQKV